MPPKSGKSKKKKSKSKLKATSKSMKSPRSSSPKEVEVSRVLEEEEERGILLEEDEGTGILLKEEQDTEKNSEEDRGIDLVDERGVDIEEDRGLDQEEERKAIPPTDEECCTEDVKQQLHTPSPQKWGVSFVDKVMHGSEEATARIQDFERASRSVQHDLVRPIAPKKKTSPYSAPLIKLRPQLPREKSAEERQVEYLEAMKRLAENTARRQAEKELKARMEREASLSFSQAKDFLRSFRKPGEETLNCSMCAGRVASMLKKGGKVLKIDFNQLLHKKFKELALQIGRKADRNYSWLKPVLTNFLVEQGMSEPEAENVELSFKNRPAMIQTADEFMQNRELIARDVQLLRGARTVYVAAARGRAGFKAHTEAIFCNHDKGITFNGGFTLEDLVILDEERVVVLADPFVPEKTQENPYGIPLPIHKCNDVKHIWRLLSPFYTRKDANDADELPLHFNDLEKEMLNVKEEEVGTEKFRELVRCAFGLASVMASVFFTKEVYTVTRQFGIGADPAMRAVFESTPTELGEWKMDAVGSPIDAVRLVALFGDGTCRFKDNRYGCIELDRHVLQHGGEYSGLDDMDELGLLTSREFKGLVHSVLKAMIYDSNPNGKYASLLSAYKTLAKHDKKDLPKRS